MATTQHFVERDSREGHAAGSLWLSGDATPMRCVVKLTKDDELPTSDRRRATSRSVDRTLHCSTVSAITHKPCARNDRTSARHAHRVCSPRERLRRGRGVTCGPALDDGPAVKLVGNCRKPASHPVATAWARAINSERLERMESASAAVTSAPDRLPRLSNEMRIPKLPQAHSPS